MKEKVTETDGIVLYWTGTKHTEESLRKNNEKSVAMHTSNTRCDKQYSYCVYPENLRCVALRDANIPIPTSSSPTKTIQPRGSVSENVRPKKIFKKLHISVPRKNSQYYEIEFKGPYGHEGFGFNSALSEPPYSHAHSSLGECTEPALNHVASYPTIERAALEQNIVIPGKVHVQLVSKYRQIPKLTFYECIP